MTSTPQLQLEYDAAAETDGELADEIWDATAILSMGSSEGIAATVAADLHARRLQAARELLRRWES